MKKWLNPQGCPVGKRFREAQPLQAELFRSRSRRPKRVRLSVPAPGVEAILSLRDSLSAQYHRRAGAKLILYHLHRDEILKASGQWLPQSPKPVLIHIPLERPAPMAEWELDFAETQQVGGEEGAEFLVVA